MQRRPLEPQHWVVMGVSGSGKTTIGRRLASHLRVTFADADDFHPQANVAKMARGEPLTDADRQPWLESVAAWIAGQQAAGRSSVVACSALKRAYRDTLRTAAPGGVLFIVLVVSRSALRRRMRQRKHHFMPSELLDSQLATLEPLASDERGMTVDGTLSPSAIVDKILEQLFSKH